MFRGEFGFEGRIKKEGVAAVMLMVAYGWLLGSKHLTKIWQEFTECLDPRGIFEGEFGLVEGSRRKGVL